MQDGVMNTEVYTIEGGDLARAGQASSRFKERLKRIGVGPKDIRRAIIAAYEAEMNVAIHARKGTMQVTIDTGQVDVEVMDQGPGISDTSLAMQEGFSTAPAFARELGFGAGMGLPNIKKNSDRFAIRSTVGEGTCVSFAIIFDPQGILRPAANSVHVEPDRCCGCLHCLRVCPTQALRVRDSTPQILEHLCIDCAACIEACETGALGMPATSAVQRPSKDTVLILPSAFVAQFGGGVPPQEVLGVLTAMGFSEVRPTETWERALQNAVVGYAHEEAGTRPVISPVCPAVVNLVEMRFPSLIENVAPFLSPMEAVCEVLGGCHVVLVAACPSQRTALLSTGLKPNVETVAPSSLRNAVLPMITTTPNAADRRPRQLPANTDSAVNVLQISGMQHVMSALEKAENGLLGDVEVIELFACDQACFGSPLLTEDPFVSRYRWARMGGGLDRNARAIRRQVPFSARTGVRLDQDISKAIEKLSKMDEVERSLPGKDCGMCGAPTCSALAEDIVLGRATASDCVHLPLHEDKTT